MYEVHENCPICKTPTPLVHLRPKFFHPLDLGRPISNELPYPNDKQSIKRNIIEGWLLYVIRSFLKVGFRFQYQIINLTWLSFDVFWFSWSLTVCFFVSLYSFVCGCPKIYFIRIFSAHLAMKICFICTTWKRK